VSSPGLLLASCTSRDGGGRASASTFSERSTKIPDKGEETDLESRSTGFGTETTKAKAARCQQAEQVIKMAKGREVSIRTRAHINPASMFVQTS
jgi:hypothetical protein